MRRFFPLLGAAIVLAISPPSTLSSQEFEEEIRRLDWFVGSWTYDQLDGGADCQRLGDFMIHCKSVWTTASGSENEAIFITRFDPQTERWRAYRFYRNGYADAAMGWVDGDSWTFVYEMPDGSRARFTAAASGDIWSYEWHRSVQGGAWEATSDGSMTRVK